MINHNCKCRPDRSGCELRHDDRWRKKKRSRAPASSVFTITLLRILVASASPNDSSAGVPAFVTGPKAQTHRSPLHFFPAHPAFHNLRPCISSSAPLSISTGGGIGGKNNTSYGRGRGREGSDTFEEGVGCSRREPERILQRPHEDGSDGRSNQRQSSTQEPRAKSPFPAMPSQTFIDLAQNQFELLANSLFYEPPSDHPRAGRGESKIKSIALYLPQENSYTGQLEFLPSALYPSPDSERVFIASQSGSGLPPTIPRTLTKLPGFAHAQSLIPAYPFASSVQDGNGAGSAAAVGTVEEVMCDASSGIRGSALSVPLYSGSRTVGVMLVWPSAPPFSDTTPGEESVAEAKFEEECFDPWTEGDKEQITRAARSIAMALSMDADRAEMRVQSEQFRVALADNLHQVKNPLQAMRTFAKLLQRKIALEEGMLEDGTHGVREGNNAAAGYGIPYMGRTPTTTTPQLLALAENMMVQSDRVVDLLLPMDLLVNSLEEEEDERRRREGLSSSYLLAPSSPPSEPVALAVRSKTRSIRESQQTKEKNEEEANAFVPKESAAVQFSRSPRGERTKIRAKKKALLTEKENSSRAPETSFVGDLEMEIAFVPDVLEPIISASQAIAAERGIAFEVQGMHDEAELPGVSLCPKSLQEAVANILDNATKYVVLGKGGRRDVPNTDPRILVSLQPNHEAYKAGVTIMVEDNGPGIPLDEREAVFARGFRGDATRLVSGSGIGLDISRSMVSRMGGMLDIVENKPGQLGGAIIRLILFREPDTASRKTGQ